MLNSVYVNISNSNILNEKLNMSQMGQRPATIQPTEFNESRNQYKYKKRKNTNIKSNTKTKTYGSWENSAKCFIGIVFVKVTNT